MIAGAVEISVGPFAGEGLDEALRLAIGLRSIRASEVMPDAELLAGRSEGFGAVARAVVGHLRSPRADPHVTASKPLLICIRRNMDLRLPASVVALFLGSAALAWAADSSPPQSRTNKEELVGIWWPDEKSKQEIRKRAPYSAMFELELRSDGKFSFVNIPKWWRNVFGRPSGKLGGISGRWSLQETSAGTEILLEAFGLSMTLGVDSERAPRRIIIHIGDADRTVAIKLFRKSGELNPRNEA